MKTRLLIALPALLLMLPVTGCDGDKKNDRSGELVVALADPPCSTAGIVVFIGRRQYGPVRPGDEITIKLPPGEYVVEASTLEGVGYAPGLVPIRRNETEFVRLGCP